MKLRNRKASTVDVGDLRHFRRAFRWCCTMKPFHQNTHKTLLSDPICIRPSLIPTHSGYPICSRPSPTSTHSGYPLIGSSSVLQVNVYLERKSLAHSLNDTKTALKQLHQIANAIVTLIMIIVILLVLGIATSHVILLVSSRLVLAGFIFGNTYKTVFEAIVFVCVMHPFDVGDRCVVDGVQMILEEMNILTTVFMWYENEKIYYPNSALATKPISNFYRSLEMGDSVEFTVDASTSIEKIGALK